MATPVSYPIRLDGTVTYLVWLMGDSGWEGQDRFQLDQSGALLRFGSFVEVEKYVKQGEISVDTTVRSELLDLNDIERWIRRPMKKEVDCKVFLDAWNLFSDLMSTIENREAHVDSLKELKIYDKLFWGNNLAAMTPPGCHYEPVWTISEVGRLRNVLSRGMTLLRGLLNEGAAS